jgi:hypothetical protein
MFPEGLSPQGASSCGGRTARSNMGSHGGPPGDIPYGVQKGPSRGPHPLPPLGRILG